MESDKSTVNKMNSVHEKNILKEKNLFTENDYEKMMIARQYNKLYETSQIENKKNQKEFDNKKFYNLSFSQLGSNLSIVFMEMINEFVVYMHNKDGNINDLFIIVTKGGRLIYIGLIFIILSILLYFIDFSQ
jgi:hypothetical protein